MAIVGQELARLVDTFRSGETATCSLDITKGQGTTMFNGASATASADFGFDGGMGSGPRTFG